MHETLLISGTILGALISCVTLIKFLFYTKSETDEKLKLLQEDLHIDLKDLKDNFDEDKSDIYNKIHDNHENVKTNVTETKEKIYQNLIEAERQGSILRQDIHDKLAQNKQTFEDYNKDVLQAISQIKQEDKELANHFIQLTNTLKDELKNDYINRYNDLLRIINTKVNISDFDRLEHKFDKVTETLTELKTIVQYQLEEQNKKNKKN